MLPEVITRIPDLVLNISAFRMIQSLVIPKQEHLRMDAYVEPNTGEEVSFLVMGRMYHAPCAITSIRHLYWWFPDETNVTVDGIWNTMGISLPDIMDMPHHRRMRAWTLIQKIWLVARKMKTENYSTQLYQNVTHFSVHPIKMIILWRVSCVLNKEIMVPYFFLWFKSQSTIVMCITCVREGGTASVV
jgi:hypothetical protein